MLVGGIWPVIKLSISADWTLKYKTRGWCASMLNTMAIGPTLPPSPFSSVVCVTIEAHPPTVLSVM